MIQHRFMVVMGMGASVVVFNTLLIAYPLPSWVLWGCIAFLSVMGLYALARLPHLPWLWHHGRVIFRRVLEDDRAPQLLLSFFLLAFSCAQAMITQQDAMSALNIFSQRLTGDDTVTWMIVMLTALVGMLVYVFREKSVFFYSGILCVLMYVGIVLLETASGQISSLGLLAVLYLLYGAGGNLLTLLAYHYHQLTRSGLERTRQDLDTAQTLITQQKGEIQHLMDDIATMRKELYDYST